MLMSQNQQYGNLGFDRNEISVYCIGVGGATVRPGGNCIITHYLEKALLLLHLSCTFM